MQCPYCEYIDGYDNKANSVINGKSGPFYVLSNDVKMVREDTASYYRREESQELHGCPECSKVFMGNV